MSWNPKQLTVEQNHMQESTIVPFIPYRVVFVFAVVVVGLFFQQNSVFVECVYVCFYHMIA